MGPIDRKFGWKRDKPDARDYRYAVTAPVSIPNRVDLRRHCSIVEDQGSLGSCVANALAGNIELLENKGATKFRFGPSYYWQNFWKWLRNMFGLGYKDVSRLFIYYNARALDGTEAQDDGTYIRNGIKTLAKDGHCMETVWPYDYGNCNVKPSAEAYDQAKNSTIVAYFKIESLNDMLVCLADGYPFVFGMWIYQSFYLAGTTGEVNLPGPGEPILGGHAVMAVGYDQAAQRLIVRNSWGRGWGDNGYFTLPYQYLDGRAEDFWTIRR